MERHDVEQTIGRELGGDERLLWSGQPRQGIFLRPSDAFLIPFSLMWCGFAIFWEASVLRTDAPLFFKLWGIPFVVVGLYFVAGRFFADARERANTAYGVTSSRIIIVGGLFKRSVRSLPLRTLPEVTLSENADGSGTITLGTSSPYNAFAAGGWTSRQNAVPALEGIKDARRVYDTIRQAQQRAA